MKNVNKERSATAIAALLVLVVFATGVLSVLLAGASAYKRVNQRDQNAYESRTATQYLATKVRQAAKPEAVSIVLFEGCQALQIAREIDGEVYVSRIYCYDGWLRELFCAADGAFAPGDGEQVLPADGLTLQLEDGLLAAQLKTGERTQRLTLTIRGGKEQLP